MAKGKKVYVVDGARTPFLKARGQTGPFSAADLAVAAARPVLTRMPFEPETITSPNEANIARIIR